MGYIYPMNGGDGAYSYTKNSQHQKEASVSAKRMFQEAIMQELEDVSGTVVRIADLGCSVGPNTFYAVGNLVEAAEAKCRPRSPKTEFQVFFNDHSSNDFSALLASLPTGRKYHAAVAPGSFHGRLFPRASITLAHSSYALHWLSKVPEGAARGNKGRIFYAGEGDHDVFDAYSGQFQRDMGDFMRARAVEMVKGGLMFLMLPGIAEGVGHERFPFATAFDLFHNSLTRLAAQGIIGESEVEGFNIPIFYPNAEEVRRAIEDNGCFCIKRVEVTNPKSETRAARDIMLLLRAAMEPLFKQHFGESATEKMFAVALAKAEEAPISHVVEADLRRSAELCYILKRS